MQPDSTQPHPNPRRAAAEHVHQPKPSCYSTFNNESFRLPLLGAASILIQLHKLKCFCPAHDTHNIHHLSLHPIIHSAPHHPTRIQPLQFYSRRSFSPLAVVFDGRSSLGRNGHELRHSGLIDGCVSSYCHECNWSE